MVVAKHNAARMTAVKNALGRWPVDDGLDMVDAVRDKKPRRTQGEATRRAQMLIHVRRDDE